MKFDSLTLVGLVFFAVTPTCTATGVSANVRANATAASLAHVHANATKKKNTGMMTVMGMLEKIERKTLSAIDAADKAFAQLEKLCLEKQQGVKLELEEAGNEVESLDALIAKLLAKYGYSAEHAAKLANQIAAEKAQLAEASALRKKEKAAFEKAEAQFVKDVGALKGAIRIISNNVERSKKEELNTEDAASLIQLADDKTIRLVEETVKHLVEASRITPADSAKLAALVQESQESSGKSSNSDEDEDSADSPYRKYKDPQDVIFVLSGEAACEGHGYNPRSCSQVGCCHYDGQCWSSVGKSDCKSPYAKVGPPAADIYEHNKSLGIVLILDQMLETTESELQKARDEEANAAFYYNKLRISMGETIENEDAEKEEDDAEANKASEDNATAQGDKKTEAELMKELQEKLDAIMTACMSQAEEHQMQSKNRKEELEAIKTAIEALKEGMDIVDCSDQVCPADTCSDGSQRRKIGRTCCACPIEACEGVICTQDICPDGFQRRPIGEECCACPKGALEPGALEIPEFMQLYKKVTPPESFLQLDSSETQGNSAVQFLKNFAKKHSSVMMAQLASKVEASMQLGNNGGDDPFVKVKGLISEMIVKLQQEAHDAANHKRYCDDNIDTNQKKKAREIKQLDFSQLNFDRWTMKQNRLYEWSEDLMTQVRDNIRDQNEMSVQRVSGRALFRVTRTEDRRSITGIKIALHVLRDYYQSEDLDRRSSKGAADTVIGILEMLEGEISKNMAIDKAAEEKAEKEYKEEKKKMVRDQAYKTVNGKNYKRSADNLGSKIAMYKADIDERTEELRKTTETLEELDKECTERAGTLAEKWKQRNLEIEGLKDALDILVNSAAPDRSADFIQLSTENGMTRDVKRGLRGVRLQVQDHEK